MSDEFIGLIAVLGVTYGATVWWFFNYITTVIRHQANINDTLISHLGLNSNDESE